MEWTKTQNLGETYSAEAIKPQDLISSMRFDPSGQFLAVGDNNGRVILFEHNEQIQKKKTRFAMKYIEEFQSHEKEFDQLKSTDIEEKINAIEWIEKGGQAKFLLTSNDKSVKLWKIFRKNVRLTVSKPLEDFINFERFELPELNELGEKWCPSLKRTFANLHKQSITLISANIDGEKFLTADDLKINIWNIEQPSTCFSVVDFEDPDPSVVVTAAKFDPQKDYMLAYSTSAAQINLLDLRKSSRAATPAIVIEDKDPPGKVTVFTPYLMSIGDFSFNNDGTFTSREYLTTKVWDPRMPDKPLETYNIFESMKSRIKDVYENDMIFDKFEVSTSIDSRHILTGMYNSAFHMIDRERKTNIQFGLDHSKKTTSHLIPPDHFEPLDDSYNFDSKTQMVSFNPKHNYLAVACLNSLFVFNGSTQESSK